MSKNTGHRPCKKADSHDLASPWVCSMNGEGNPDLNEIVPVAATTKKYFMYWYKPVGDVYRLVGHKRTMAWHGLSIYDSWPQFKIAIAFVTIIFLTQHFFNNKMF